MLRMLLYFLLSLSFTFGQNFNSKQIELDLEHYKKEVYLCFDKDTLSSGNFSKNDLESFRFKIASGLGYNFVYHILDRENDWKDLVKKQHGVQYAVVCSLRMNFGVSAKVVLYYQDPPRDLQWERVKSVSYETKEKENWIERSSSKLCKDIKGDNPINKEISKLEKLIEKIKEENKNLKETIEKISENNKIEMAKWSPSKSLKKPEPNKEYNVVLDKERYNTNSKYFSRTSDKNHIVIHESGYYRITAKVLTFLPKKGSCVLYLRNGDKILEISSIGYTGYWTTLTINHTGHFEKNAIINLTIKHHNSTSFAYEAGNFNTMVSIENILTNK